MKSPLKGFVIIISRIDMLLFPYYGEFAAFSLIMCLLGLGLGAASIFGWKSKLDERHKPPIDTIFQSNESKEEIGLFGLILGTFGSIVFVCVGGFMLIFGAYDVYQFRSLPLSELEGLKVYRAEKAPLSNPSQFVVIKNEGQLIAVFQTLQKCTVYSKGRERFGDGYKIELIFKDQRLANHYISIYRRSNPTQPPSYVTPHIGNDRTMNLGEYTCPEFDNWITQNIDPLFLDPASKN